jgi:hypothetical protein
VSEQTHRSTARRARPHPHANRRTAVTGNHTVGNRTVRNHTVIPNGSGRFFLPRSLPVTASARAERNLS